MNNYGQIGGTIGESQSVGFDPSGAKAATPEREVDGLLIEIEYLVGTLDAGLSDLLDRLAPQPPAESNKLGDTDFGILGRLRKLHNGLAGASSTLVKINTIL